MTSCYSTVCWWISHEQYWYKNFTVYIIYSVYKKVKTDKTNSGDKTSIFFICVVMTRAEIRQKGDVLRLDLNSYTGCSLKFYQTVHFCALSKYVILQQKFAKSKIRFCYSCYQNKALTNAHLNIFSFYYHLLLLVIVMIFRWITLSVRISFSLGLCSQCRFLRHFAFFARFQLI